VIVQVTPLAEGAITPEHIIGEVGQLLAGQVCRSCARVAPHPCAQKNGWKRRGWARNGSRPLCCTGGGTHSGHGYHNVQVSRRGGRGPVRRHRALPEGHCTRRQWWRHRVSADVTAVTYRHSYGRTRTPSNKYTSLTAMSQQSVARSLGEMLSATLQTRHLHPRSTHAN
jgi:hypothetical protein